jgi:hypothetical protein
MPTVEAATKQLAASTFSSAPSPRLTTHHHHTTAFVALLAVCRVRQSSLRPTEHKAPGKRQTTQCVEHRGGQASVTYSDFCRSIPPTETFRNRSIITPYTISSPLVCCSWSATFTNRFTFHARSGRRRIAREEKVMNISVVRPGSLVMIPPRLHLRRPCYDFYFL